ncbi:MAG TPA: MBOAT family protein [Steroidobacteraceae bacterium]|nr:MBOAT family protein [Steroidobacteraceae bacterium]
MLFTTAQFVFVFLPLSFAVFFLLGRFSTYWAAASLFVASVVFYSVSSLPFTALLLVSIALNFWIGGRINAASSPSAARMWLTIGIVADMLALAYFKYAGFLASNLELAIGSELAFEAPPLPVGISFFTFTQIAYLVDTYKRHVTEYRAAHYGLFVTFFPHLVAGPVLHHAQMMPQFQDDATYRMSSRNIAVGLLIFTLGLFKKVVIADGISPYADASFNAAADGQSLTMLEGWVGALAYTFQLYFDFSGYSDMAIGLSRIFNIQLPFNFNSPYKSLNISDFWRRWHISLSTFLRDYLYISMGGNRHGKFRRYANLFITMLLGGLWHGASWTFVFWGALHGAYLMVQHAFSALRFERPKNVFALALGRSSAWLLTFLAVVVAWVFFRATSFDAAQEVLRSMVDGSASLEFAANPIFWNSGLSIPRVLVACSVLMLSVVALPNSNWMGERMLDFFAKRLWMAAIGIGVAAVFVTFLVVVNESRDAVSAFIYFNF